MLQRIQSVFLVITAIAIGVFLGTNSYIKVISPTEKVAVNPYHVYHQSGQMALFDKPIYYVAILAGLALFLSVYSIFQYKNRLRQILFVALNSLLIGSAMAVSMYHIQNDAIPIGPGEGSFSIGSWAAGVALLSNWLANRFIRKDEKMVKDADRMR